MSEKEHVLVVKMADDMPEFLPLDKAVALTEEECKNRDAEKAKTPMTNFKATEGAKFGLPLEFWASWTLDKDSRPRRIALLLDDCQEEYRDYALEIIPNLQKLHTTFRDVKARIDDSDAVETYWSAWSRTYEDGISNAMDRWYGPRGLRPDEPENAVYIFTGSAGAKTITEIEPTKEEQENGYFFLSRHLDMFWNFDPRTGKSYLDERLKAKGIDTVVIAGLWIDECIVSTAYAAFSRGYDVIVVEDACATATAHKEKAMTILNGVCSKVLTTDSICKYMENDFQVGEIGAVKGVKHPDGRKD